MAASIRPSSMASSQRRTERDGARQLRVHAGGQRQAGHLAEVLCESVGGGDHLDAHVIRRDDAVEPPLVTQDRRQQLDRGVSTARRRRRNRPASRWRSRRGGPPPRMAGAVHRGAPSVRYVQVPGSDRPPPARGRPCASPSPAPHPRGPRPWRAATYAQPSSVARYGSSPYVSSVRPQRGSAATSKTGARACRAPVSSIRRRIVLATAVTASVSNVAAAPIDCWKLGSGPRDQAMEAFLVDDRRDPESRPLDELALDRIGRDSHLARPQVRRPGQTRDVTDPVGCKLGQPVHVETVIGDRPRIPRTTRAVRPSRPPSSGRGGR